MILPHIYVIALSSNETDIYYCNHGSLTGVPNVACRFLKKPCCFHVELKWCLAACQFKEIPSVMLLIIPPVAVLLLNVLRNRFIASSNSVMYIMLVMLGV